MAFSANCLPTARPVHLDLLDGELVVALGRDVDRSTLKDGDIVAIEIDDASNLTPATWIVTVTGRILGTLDRAGDALDAGKLSWAVAEELTLLRLSIDRLEGCSTEPATC
jgi:hypothetical protein